MGFLDRLVARDHRMAAEKRDTAEWRGDAYESASEKAARKDKERADKAAAREEADSRQRARGHRRSLAKQDAKERRNDFRRW